MFYEIAIQNMLEHPVLNWSIGFKTPENLFFPPLTDNHGTTEFPASVLKFTGV